MFELGMIVKRGIEFGVIIEVNDTHNSCAVEWFNEDCDLKTGWWIGRDLQILEDPCKKYRKERKIIVTTDKNDKKVFKVDSDVYEYIAEYFQELVEKYNGFYDIYEDYAYMIEGSFEDNDIFEWEIETTTNEIVATVCFQLEKI